MGSDAWIVVVVMQVDGCANEMTYGEWKSGSNSSIVKPTRGHAARGIARDPVPQLFQNSLAVRNTSVTNRLLLS